MPFTRDQIEDINQIVKTAANNLMSDENFIKLIAETVAKTVTATVLQAIEQKFDEQKKELDSLKDKVKSLEAQKNENEQKIDKLEQYTRRNSLRVFGIKESMNENLEDKVLQFFKNQLNEDIKMEQVDRMHRVGKFKNGGTRAIIIKFVSYQHRAIIFGRKRMLKGSGYLIKEDLTADRVKLLKSAETKFGRKNTWSKDGKIYVSANNAIKLISSFKDLN